MTVELEREDDSIRLAVERETRRRKKALAGFLALLLIPIAIGGWVLARAPRETELVVREVTPLVQRDVEKTVGENVTRQVLAQSEPLIERRVEEKVAPIRAIRDEVKTLTSEVARIRPVVAENARMVADVRSQVARLPRPRPEPQIDNRPLPDRRLDAIDGQLQKQQEALDDIIRRLTILERRLQNQ